jgi:hypothetical protein
MISLLVFLTLQSFAMSAKFDRLSDQVYVMRSDLDTFKQRLGELEKSNRP